MKPYDVIIIGAGAAGLMCAIESGKRGRNTLVLDHANKPGKKILMSGGGRCNFTNYGVTPECYISHNAHFCKSALNRYTSWDFISLVEKYDIPYHEKTLGQLFCDNKAKDIVNMLLAECQLVDSTIQLNTSIHSVTRDQNSFLIHTSFGDYACESLVIASGGLSIPTMGATPFGYQLAKQFGHKIWPTSAGLVPFTMHTHDKEHFSSLSGISAYAQITSQSGKLFKENILFTHRGLSGPASLQISSYWNPGESIDIDLLPDINIKELIQLKRGSNPDQTLKTLLAEHLPKRLLSAFLETALIEKPIKQLTDKDEQHITKTLKEWTFLPNGTEGYRTAEVTLGGVDCNELSSKTMESMKQSGLYFIGEVVDVTGWLGGYNFQWAWASGWCAGQVA